MSGYIGAAPVTQAERFQKDWVATAGQTTFIFPYTPTFLDFYLNGVRLDTSEYTATNGTSLVLNVGASLNDQATSVSWSTFAVATAISVSTTALLNVGYTTNVETLSSDTIAPDLAEKIIKIRAVAGNVIINFPSGGNGICHIILTIDGTDRTISLGTNVYSIGSLPTLNASGKYLVTVIRDTGSHSIVQINEISG